MAIWVPHPSEIRPLYDAGASGESMGLVTDSDSKARFWLDIEVCYTLIYIRGTFESVSSDTGTADFVIKVDSHRMPPSMVDDVGEEPLTSPYDFTLYTLPSVGIDNQIAFRVLPDEYPFWTFRKGDVCVFEWTNPDDQRWALEVGLCDTSRMPV